MKFNKFFLVSMLLLAILALGAVSASDEISDDITAVEPSDDVITDQIDETDSQDEVLEDEPTEALSLADLKSKIEDDQAPMEIKLENDYKHSSTDEEITYITTTNWKAQVLDGQGHTIDGNGKDLIFKVSQHSNFTMKNIIFKNFNRTVEIESGTRDFIQWDGPYGVIENCTFENISSGTKGILICLQSTAYDDTYTTTIDKCTFKDIYMDNPDYATSFIKIYSSNVYLNNSNFTNVNASYIISDDPNAELLHNTQINNCTFKDNYAVQDFINIKGANSQINDCTFRNNHGNGFGYITYQYGDNSKMYNCTFESNFATYDESDYRFPIARFGYIFGDEPIGENISVSKVTFKDNVGIPIGWDAVNGTVTDCVFENNNGTIKVDKGTVTRDNGKYDFEVVVYNDTIVGYPENNMGSGTYIPDGSGGVAGPIGPSPYGHRNTLAEIQNYGDRSGNIAIYLNDSECYNKIMESNNVSIELDELENVPIGDIHIVIKFISADEELVLYDDTVKIDYYLTIVNYGLMRPLYPHDSLTVSIGLPKDATGTLIFNDGIQDHVIEYSDGVANYTLNGTVYNEVGEYGITVRLTGDEKYPDKADASSIYLQPKVEPPQFISEGESEFIYLDFPDNCETNIKLYNMTETLEKGELIYEGTVKGIDKISLPILEEGRHNFFLEINDDDENGYQIILDCIKNNEGISISIESNTIELGDDAVIDVRCQLPNCILYVLVDTSYPSYGNYEQYELNEIEFIHHISDLTLGEHRIKLLVYDNSEVVYPWDDPVMVYSTNFIVDVTGKDPKLSIEPIADIEVGQNITVVITADSGFSANVTVSVGTVNDVIEVINGSGTKEIATDTLPAGETTITISSEAVPNYKDDTASFTFNIMQEDIDPGLNIEDIADVMQGFNILVVVSADSGFSGTVNVTVGNKKDTIEIIGGSGSKEFSTADLAPGETIVTVSSDAIPGYSADTACTTFNILADETEHNVTVPEYVWVNGDYNIIVESPDDYDYDLKVGIYNYGGTVLLTDLYEGPAKGKVSIPLDLSDVQGSLTYKVIVFFHSVEFGRYDLNPRDESPYYNISIGEIPEERMTYDEYGSLGYYYFPAMPYFMNGTLNFYVDDEIIASHSFNMHDTSDVYLIVDYSKVSFGEHNWRLTLTDDVYCFDNSTEGTINLKWYAIPNPIKKGAFDEWGEINYDTLIVRLDPEKTGFVTLFIDGNEYASGFTKDGNLNISLADLSSGVHSYEITVDGDEQLSDSGTLTVETNLQITVENCENGVVPYIDSVKIIAFVAEDATGNVSFVLDDQDADHLNLVCIKNGYAFFNAINLTEGEHTVYVKYHGDSKYGEIAKSVTFNMADYAIFLKYKDLPSDEQVKPIEYISLRLPDDAQGYLIVKNRDGTFIKEVPLVDGYAKVMASDLLKGQNMYILSYNGTDYNVGQKFININNGPAVATEISNVVVIGQDGYAYAFVEDATGNLIVSIDGNVIGSQAFSNSVANLSFSPDDLLFIENINVFGPHEIGLKYEGSDYSDVLDFSCAFTIEPIDLSVDTAPPAASIELPDDASGTLKIYVDYFLNKTETVSGGKAYVSLDEIEPGNHIILVVYNDSKYGEFVKDFSELYFYKEPSMTVETPEGDVPTVIVNLDDDARGSVHISIDGKGYSQNIDNGVAKFEISGLENGEYIVAISYSGDDRYYSISQNTTIKIEGYGEKDPQLTIAIDDIVIGENATVVITTDKAFSGIVKVQIDGGEFMNVSVSEGYGQLNIPNLNLGNHTAKAIFEAIGEFNASEKETSFEVKKVVIPDNGTIIDVGDSSKPTKTPTYSINLPEDATGNFTVTVNGKNYTAELVKGKATVKVTDLPPGDYDVTLTYSGDDKYSPIVKKTTAKVITDPKIVAKNYKAYYNKGKYSVTVYGTNGKVAKGVAVVFKINGKKVKTVKTNAKGVATFKISKKYVPKKYKISATALGKTVTKKLTIKQVLKLKKVKIRKSKKRLVLKATLKEGKKALKGKKITFRFKGKKYTKKTNKKGIAKVTIKKKVLKKLKKGKKVTYKATYLKDTVKRTVKVKK